MIAKKKRESHLWLQIHSIMHVAVSILLVGVNNLGKVWIITPFFNITGWVCIFFIYFFHLIEDWWRIWSVKRKLSYDTTIYFIWDQIIHFVAIFIFSPYTSNTPETLNAGFFIYPSVSTAELGWITHALIVFVISTHFTTILIYFLEHDLYGGFYLPTFPKYFGILERIFIISVFLIPGKWWLFILPLWIVRGVIRYKVRIFDVSWLQVGVGYPLAILCGIYLRLNSKFPWLE